MNYFLEKSQLTYPNENQSDEIYFSMLNKSIARLALVMLILGCMCVSKTWAACESELKADLASNIYSDAQKLYDSVHTKREFPRESRGIYFYFNWPTHSDLMSSQFFRQGSITVENKSQLSIFLSSEVTKIEESLRNGEFNRAIEKQLSWATNATLRNNIIREQNNFRATVNFKICIAKYYLGLEDSKASSSGSLGLSGNQIYSDNNPKSNLTQQSSQQGQINQSAQQQSQKDRQSAQQNQARADQQRQGQRKTHDPAAEAHECIAIDKAGSGNFGAFKNQCPYPVNFYSCNEKPRTIQGGFNWSADFDCAKQQLGLYTPKANSSVAAHNRNTEFVHWFACKAPATPTDATYVPGKGIEARCYN